MCNGSTQGQHCRSLPQRAPAARALQKHQHQAHRGNDLAPYVGDLESTGNLRDVGVGVGDRGLTCATVARLVEGEGLDEIPQHEARARQRGLMLVLGRQSRPVGACQHDAAANHDWHGRVDADHEDVVAHAADDGKHCHHDSHEGQDTAPQLCHMRNPTTCA